MGKANGYRICSVDGSRLYKSESSDFEYKFTLLDEGTKRFNFKNFDMLLDNSLDICYLRDVVYPRHSKEMNGKHLLVGKDKKSTAAVINVTFDHSIKAFEHVGGGLYVDPSVNDVKSHLEDHRYIDEKGELIGIEVKNQGKRKKKNYDDVQNPVFNINDMCSYFEYDENEKAYILTKKGKDKIERTVTREEIREYLYENGFTVDGIDYTRYKRSAGSGRDGSCLFIAKPLYDDMMRWSGCGLDSDLIEDKASWEAYISLTLSGMIDEINIPKEGILLLPDAEAEGWDDVVAIMRGDNKNDNGETVDLIAERRNVKYKNKIWDGEALLDESVFELLELKNSEENKDKTKHGMMLLRNRMFKTCAFRTGLQRFFADNNIDDVKKLGGFTLATSLKDIKLVVTESSIKYIKLAKGIYPDCSMEDLFRKWLDVIYGDKKGKTFGIVKQDKKSGPLNNQCVYTNYQLINTLALDENSAQNLLKDSLDLLHKIQTDPMYLRYQGQIHVAEAEEENIEENDGEFKTDVDSNYRYELMCELLSRSDKAERLAIYKEYRDDLTDNFKKRLKGGRIIVEGNYQTLFGNPLEFLYATIGVSYKDAPRPLLDGEIYTKRFPDGVELLCARSPHITMGNILVAKNRHIPEIDKYFCLGESDSIVCINAIESNIMQRLNGCDYDSDTMLITDNDIMLSAAKKNLLNFPVPHSEIIEPPKSDQQKGAKNKLHELDIKISQNKVGEIVNLSQFLNSLYWDKSSLGETEELEEIYNDICKLAVLSGIEIDRAKRDMKISARGVLDALRKRWKTPYIKGNEKMGISGSGGMPRFLAEATDRTGKNRDKISKTAVLNAPLSYVYDVVANDGGRNDSGHKIAYIDFFNLKKPKPYDQSASRRAQGFYNFAIEVSNKIRKENIKAKNKTSGKHRAVIGENIKSILADAILESAKQIRGEAEYYYAFELMTSASEDQGTKENQTSKRMLIYVYLLCYTNNMHLLRSIVDTSAVRELKQDDTIPLDEAYDIIYGHSHKIL